MRSPRLGCRHEQLAAADRGHGGEDARSSADAVLGCGQDPGDVCSRRTHARSTSRPSVPQSSTVRLVRLARVDQQSPQAHGVECRSELGTAGEDAQAVPAGRKQSTAQLPCGRELVGKLGERVWDLDAGEGGESAAWATCVRDQHRLGVLSSGGARDQVGDCCCPRSAGQSAHRQQRA